MFALYYSGFGSSDVLAVGEAKSSHDGPGQIGIAAHASGVTPTDVLLRAGRLRPLLDWPHIFGVDTALIVDEIGPGIDGTRR